MIELAYWRDPESPLRIEYSRQAMEAIRQLAVEGLKALPRTGLGVGGLLLGERAGTRVRILDSIELPCSHAFGPQFLLTPQEKARAKEIVRSVENPAVVGWYCSHTRGELDLAEADLELYRELFPAEWQITFLVLGELDRPARAAFYCSSQNGLIKGAEHDLHIWIPGLSETEPADIPPLESPGAGLSDTEPEIPAAIAQPPVRESQPRWRTWTTGWVMSWVLTAVAALAVGAAAFEVQNTWLTERPAPPPVTSQLPQQIP